MLKWDQGPDMPQPRAGYIAGVQSGRFVLAGGSYWMNGERIVSARTDVYDPLTAAWEPGPALPRPVANAACAMLDGAIYSFGGVYADTTSNSLLRLDTRGWTQIQQGLCPKPRASAVATSLKDSMYVFGGLTGSNNSATVTRELYKWNQGTSWEMLAPFPGESRIAPAFCSAGGKLYLFGGACQNHLSIRNLASAWVYDPPLNCWAELPALPTACRAWGSVAFSDTKILLFGGFTDVFSSAIYQFDIQSYRTDLVAYLPYPLADAKFIAIGSRLITAGGETALKVRAPWTLVSESVAAEQHAVSQSPETK